MLVRAGVPRVVLLRMACQHFDQFHSGSASGHRRRVFRLVQVEPAELWPPQATFGQSPRLDDVRLDFSYRSCCSRPRRSIDHGSRNRLLGLSDGFRALWLVVSALSAHLRALVSCQKCPAMHKPVVVGSPVGSRILLIGQAPGIKEPQLGRPFAWTAGKTLFGWIQSALGWDEETTRSRIYFAAVCRCFPGKSPHGGDRVPGEHEIRACSDWLRREFGISPARGSCCP